jgi:hypothetical protein
MKIAPILTLKEFENFLRTSLSAPSGVWSRETIPKGFLSDDTEEPYAFDLDDLYYLYCLTRQSAAVSVLEFGSGWSTLAFAKAIEENRKSMVDGYKVRHPNPFKVMSIEASGHWMGVTLSRCPAILRKLIIPQVTAPKLIELHGSYVSVYERIPPFTPDIIYLDGPDPEQVTGSIDGYFSLERHGLPMSADILRIEPHLWPWTLIVTDGRTANARYLQANMQRNWQYLHDPFGDRATFRLDETPFGPITEDHLASRLKFARGTGQ